MFERTVLGRQETLISALGVVLLEPVLERVEEHCECFVAALKFRDLLRFSIVTIVDESNVVQLTYLSPSDRSSLFHLQSLATRARIEELNEAISLLNRYLSKLAILMEEMEKITLGNPFRREVSYSLLEKGLRFTDGTKNANAYR